MIDIGTCVNYGVESLKRNPAYAIGGALCVMIVGSLTGGLCTGPMLVGYQRGLLKEDQGAKAEIGDVFKGFDSFVPALVAALISGVLICIGMVLCILPGILIGPIATISIFYVTTGENDGVNAVKRAWTVLQPNLLMAVICSLVLGLIVCAGALLFGIGMLLTAPIGMAGLMKMAQQMTGEGSPAAA